jgi:RNA polymerase sigma factor (sigma-70 family)
MTFFDGDSERLKAFRVGHRSVLEQVFRTYADDVGRVLRLGFRLDREALVVPGLHDVDREKELLQEVFVRAFNERARLAYNPLQPYRPYLMQIARNLLLDEHRRRGRAQGDVAQAALAEAVDLEPSADLALETLRLKEATAAYCQSLEQGVQQFIRLRFDEGLSQADVAQRLGVTRRRVRTLEELVHAGLREFLQARGLIDR